MLNSRYPLRQIKRLCSLNKVSLRPMDDYHHQMDYIGFMNWFKQKHPELHAKHADSIIPPKDNKGLQVSPKGIDKPTYNLLYELQNDYYISTM